MFIRVNLLHGRLSESISVEDTTMKSDSLIDAPVVANGDRIRLVLNPLAQNGEPEIVDITAHSGGSDTATIQRAVESSERFPATVHPSGTGWAASDTIETMKESADIGLGRKVEFQWSTPSASSEWEIQHDLGFRPSGIIVIDSAGTTMYGFEVSYPDLDSVVLRFNAPFNGTAYLS